MAIQRDLDEKARAAQRAQTPGYAPMSAPLPHQSSVAGFAVHFDPVIAHSRPHAGAVHVRNDQVRGLHRHMAINAVLRDLRAQLGVHAAFFGPVAGQAVA